MAPLAVHPLCPRIQSQFGHSQSELVTSSSVRVYLSFHRDATEYLVDSKHLRSER